MKKQLVVLPGLLALGLGPLAQPAQAWGRVAHRVVTQVAVYELPAGMQAFYFRHLPEIVRQSSAADDRRATDPREGPRHYLMLDHYAEDNPFARIPHRYEDAEEKFSADTLAKYGTLPWAVLEAKTKLSAAFSTRDTAEILHYSAELSHYMADVYAPLHTTVNYNGQYTSQVGMQELYETQLPERYIATYKLAAPQASAPKDPSAAVWQALQLSYGFVDATFSLESQASKGFTNQTKYSYSHRFGHTQRHYSPAFVEAYEKLAGGQAAFLLKAAAPSVAALWLAAWQEAGRPDLGGLMQPAKLTTDEKQTLDTQLKAWQANTLGDDHLLLALQKEQAAEAPDVIKAASGDIQEQPAPEPAPAPVPAAAATPAPPRPATPATGWDAPAAPARVKTKEKGPAGTTKQKAKPAPSGWN